MPKTGGDPLPWDSSVKKPIVAGTLVLAAMLLVDALRPSELPTERLPQDELIQTVSTGEVIDLASVLDDEHWTVVQFTAPWCPACRQLDPELERLVLERGSVRLRKIDIRSWDSPVAQAFGIRSIPQLWLHEGTERVATDAREVLRRLAQ